MLVALRVLPALSPLAVAVALVVLLVERVQLLMLADQEHFMVEEEPGVLPIVLLQQPPVDKVQSESSGPVQPVHSHLLVQVTCK